MNNTEPLYRVVDENDPTLTEGLRVAPNEGSFPTDATIFVETEEQQKLTFQIAPDARQKGAFVFKLIDAVPPLSQGSHDEIHVLGDKIVKGRELLIDISDLSSPDPLLARVAFKVARIRSNIERLN